MGSFAKPLYQDFMNNPNIYGNKTKMCIWVYVFVYEAMRDFKKPPLYEGFAKPLKVPRGFIKFPLYGGFLKLSLYRDFVKLLGTSYTHSHISVLFFCCYLVALEDSWAIKEKNVFTCICTKCLKGPSVYKLLWSL